MQNQMEPTGNLYFPESVRVISREGGTLALAFTDRSGETFLGQFTFLDTGAVRVRIYEHKFVKLKYDVVDQTILREGELCLEETEQEIRVRFAGFSLRFGKNPFSMGLYGQTGEVIYEEQMKDVNSVGEGLDQIPPLGYFKDEQGKITGINLAPKLHWDEHIYGLGEHFTEFDKRGQQVRMYNADTLGCRDGAAYKNIPFYISSYGYGLFVNHCGIYDFEVGSRSSSSISICVPDRQLEYYLIPGDSLKEILSTYMKLTGPAALPPEWSFGLWYSTGFKGNSRANVEKDAAGFREHQIPCSVMHFDCYWLRENMWCDFVWDDAQYPDRIGMLAELKKQGFRICLWINPYISRQAELFQEGCAGGYLVKKENGEAYTADLWHGLLPWCGIVDFTNPDAAAWYQSKIAGLLSEGVDVLKTDFAEDIPEDAVFFNGQTGKEMRNFYSRLYNEAVFAVTCREKGKENGLVWARSGCAGMQKFPVCWSGDPQSTFEGMAATLRGGLSLAMSGVPFWSHDMGGFYGQVTGEVLVRWSQFGLFCSHSRLHGTTTRQPWAYGEEVLAILKKFIAIRYELMPYIIENAKKCVEEGISFLRPLVLEHPQDPAAASIWDEYYFGERMLVCPVFGGRDALRKFYLPEGEWTDYLTKERYEGGRWYQRRCPLDYLPLFYKGEAPGLPKKQGKKGEAPGLPKKQGKKEEMQL